MMFTIIALLLALTFADAWDNANDHGHWGHGTHGISLNQESGWDNYHHHEPAHYAHHDHHHDSHYVAKTLGAVHTAPLPGHIKSVKSFNVAPAPEFGWNHHHHHHHASAHHDNHNHHHASHYIAKTLGAVHTAPLPGHIHSVKSFNVAPAPGLGWDHHAPAHHDHHDNHHHHHASHYVAKTLGAVHSAPLPGHIHTVKSFNVASAPGTH